MTKDDRTPDASGNENAIALRLKAIEIMGWDRAFPTLAPGYGGRCLDPADAETTCLTYRGRAPHLFRGNASAFCSEMGQNSRQFSPPRSRSKQTGTELRQIVLETGVNDGNTGFDWALKHVDV